MAHKKKHGKPRILSISKGKPRIRAKGKTTVKSKPIGRKYVR